MGLIILIKKLKIIRIKVQIKIKILKVKMYLLLLLEKFQNFLRMWKNFSHQFVVEKDKKLNLYFNQSKNKNNPKKKEIE